MNSPARTHGLRNRPLMEGCPPRKPLSSPRPGRVRPGQEEPQDFYADTAAVAPAACFAKISSMSAGLNETSQDQRPKLPWVLTARTHSSRSPGAVWPRVLAGSNLGQASWSSSHRTRFSRIGSHSRSWDSSNPGRDPDVPGWLRWSSCRRSTSDQPAPAPWPSRRHTGKKIQLAVVVATTVESGRIERRLGLEERNASSE